MLNLPLDPQGKVLNIPEFDTKNVYSDINYSHKADFLSLPFVLIDSMPVVSVTTKSSQPTSSRTHSHTVDDEADWSYYPNTLSNSFHYSYKKKPYQAKQINSLHLLYQYLSTIPSTHELYPLKTALKDSFHPTRSEKSLLIKFPTVGHKTSEPQKATLDPALYQQLEPYAREAKTLKEYGASVQKFEHILKIFEAYAPKLIAYNDTLPQDQRRLMSESGRKIDLKYLASTLKLGQSARKKLPALNAWVQWSHHIPTLSVSLDKDTIIANSLKSILHQPRLGCVPNCYCVVHLNPYTGLELGSITGGNLVFDHQKTANDTLILTPQSLVQTVPKLSRDPQFEVQNLMVAHYAQGKLANVKNFRHMTNKTIDKINIFIEQARLQQALLGQSSPDHLIHLTQNDSHKKVSKI